MVETQSIRRLVIRATTQDVLKSTNELNKLSDAQTRVSESGKVMYQQTDTSAKRALTAEAAYKRQTMQVDEVARSQARIAKETRTADTALAQGLITQSEYAKRLEMIQSRYEVGVQAGGRYASALSSIQTQYLAISAAAGIAAIGMKSISDAALALADRAGKLKDFADTTGYTTDQLQALEKAGAQVGVSQESVTKALEKLSVSLDDVKKSTGSVYDAVLGTDPALAKQLARVNNVADAWDLLAKASAKADLTQRNALAKAAFGRGGIEITRLQASSVEAGGLKGLVGQLNELDKITSAQTKKWDDLGDAIAENMRAAKQNIASIFTETVLEGAERFSKAFLDLTQTIKAFTLGEDFKSFLEWSKTPAGMAVLAGGAGAALGGMVAGPIGALAGGATGAFTGAARGLQYQERGNQAERYGTPLAVSGPNIVPGEMDEAIAKMQAMKEETIRSYNEMAKWVGVLGSAATPAEKYQLELLKIGKELAANTINEQQAGRARAEAARTLTTDTLNARISALGDAASMTDVLRAKELQLARANQQGAGLTRDQINTQLEITAAQKLGTYQIDSMIMAEQARAKSLFMSKEAALAYNLVQEKINAAIQSGKPLTEQEIELLRRKAEAYAHTKTNADNLEDAIRSARENSEVFAKDFVAGMMAGKSAMEALGNAAKNLAGKMADKALTSLFSGQYEKAAVEATIAVGAALIGKNADQEKAREEWAKTTPAFAEFITVGASERAPTPANINERNSIVSVEYRRAA